MDCLHGEFQARVEVTRLTDHPENRADGYACDVRVTCVECGTRFVFVGLPGGSNLSGGATCSADGAEARLVIAPAPQLG